MGRLDLRRIQGNHDIEEHLDRFFGFYARTWKGEEPNAEFYYELFESFDRMGALRFYGLTLNEEAIAYLVCILAGDTMYGVKTTYDPSYYAYSPGVILFYKCIEDMFNISGIREFDIGRGDEQFKREWTSVFHDHSRIFVYPKTTLWDVTNKVRYDILPLLKGSSTFNKAYSFFRSLLTDDRDDRNRSKGDEEEMIRKSVSWEALKDRPEPQNLLALRARAEDLNHVVVSMASPNIKDVQDRLEKQECVLVWQDTKVVAFFWISPEDGGRANNEGFEQVNVDQWGVKPSEGNVDIETDCIHLLFNFFQGEGREADRIELRCRRRC